MTKGDETRQAILHRGVEAAYRVGLTGLTIGELASATGMSKSGLYAHFRSKESLQLAVLGQARAEFIDTVVAPALRTPRGEPRQPRRRTPCWIGSRLGSRVRASLPSGSCRSIPSRGASSLPR
ncbi:TetR/AcrR family transcriptional regulator [Cellulosimicrobium funkei]|uniref:TetR/AcrR family transcriptional regulator n=1 Tax=Cellulosimicrobium funkei TaxID=264251 RepID=UPI003701D89D